MFEPDPTPMRLVLAAVLLLCTTAFCEAVEGAPGSEDQTLQCRLFDMGCKAPTTVEALVAEQPAAPPRTKVATVKRKPKPKADAPVAAAPAAQK